MPKENPPFSLDRRKFLKAAFIAGGVGVGVGGIAIGTVLGKESATEFSKNLALSAQVDTLVKDMRTKLEKIPFDPTNVSSSTNPRQEEYRTGPEGYDRKYSYTDDKGIKHEWFIGQTKNGPDDTYTCSVDTDTKTQEITRLLITEGENKANNYKFEKDSDGKSWTVDIGEGDFTGSTNTEKSTYLTVDKFNAIKDAVNTILTDIIP